MGPFKTEISDAMMKRIGILLRRWEVPQKALEVPAMAAKAVAMMKSDLILSKFKRKGLGLYSCQSGRFKAQKES